MVGFPILTDWCNSPDFVTIYLKAMIQNNIKSRYLITEQQAQVIFEHTFFNLLIAEMENKKVQSDTKLQAPSNRKKVIKITSEQYARLGSKVPSLAGNL